MHVSYAERRAAMAAHTRARILDACAALLARGELTVPAVARAANVSVPTVYRHFSDKQALVRATARHVRARVEKLLHAALRDLPARDRRRVLRVVAPLLSPQGLPAFPGVARAGRSRNGPK
jgi:AcrR family transcriptional regulator